MKVAYLILAHRQPGLVAGLVRALACDWASFFIHVDAKSDLAPFQRLLAAQAGVTWLTGARRVKVSWGGFSQVRATLNLLDAALAADRPFTRYCLLSGADFPIKPLAVIRERLVSDQEFMRVDHRLSGAGVVRDGLAATVRRYFFPDWPLPRRIKLTLLSGKIPRRPYPGIPLYHGAQWWALTAACVRFVVDFVQDHPDYAAFHRYTLAPDEIFFHSIVKHSPFAGQLSHDCERAASLTEYYASNDHGCHYIDWNAPQQALPKVLTMADLPALQRSAALFARKFDETCSRELLQALVAKETGGGDGAAPG